MSVCVCKDCDRLIDSDDDPDCFVKVGNNGYDAVCESCRTVREADAVNSMPPDWEPTPAQQAIMDAAEDAEETDS